MKCPEAINAIRQNRVTDSIQRHVEACPDCKIFFDQHKTAEQLMLSELKRESSVMPSNRCPDDNLIAAYIEHNLETVALEGIEKHLASCDYCLSKVNIASNSTDIPAGVGDIQFQASRLKSLIQGNIPLILSVLSFALSFLIPRYFMQFVVVATVLGIYVALEKSNALMLGKIYRLWRRGQDEKADEHIEKLKKRVKRVPMPMERKEEEKRSDLLH